MAMVQQQRNIEIPIKGTDDVLEVEVANLPIPSETIAILIQQDCTINYWILLALEYYRQRNLDAFELILEGCLAHWDLDRVLQEAEKHPKLKEDRVRALDLLAVYYVRKAVSATKDMKRDFSTKATQKLTEVDKVGIATTTGPVYQNHLMCRAYLIMMLDARIEQAEQTFNFVLTQKQQSGEPDSIPSLLAKACIEFGKKEPSGKRNALGLYRKALQICPNCPADVRLGLGICFYKLNMFEKAEAAFKRALALDPKCVGALIGLAVIELNKKLIDSIKRGIECLSRAFKIEPTNSMVSTLLADHFFYANEHDKVIKLATRASENTENDFMKAQALYQLGRAYHKKEEFEHAFHSYEKATQLGGPHAFLAYYGLGQIYIHQGELDLATQAFETVLGTNPDNNETLKILASLYARTNSQAKKDQAKTYLKKVTENCPDDVESWFELASLCEQHDTQAALNSYRKCIELYEAQSTPVPVEVYNNIAALLFSINSLDESENYYNLAKERCLEEEPNDPSHYESIRYTIDYNIGRLCEAKHELQKAEAIYKRVLIDHPMYRDCYLRLGCMERDKGWLYNASDKFKEVLRTDEYDPEAWILIGNMHLAKLELTPGQKKFEIILKRCEGNPDGYSLISVGNVWLQSQYMCKDEEKISMARKRALLFYSTALKHDPKNIYAANGIGCVFAVKGMFNEARDIFSQVREATAEFPDVWVNIAHIYVQQKQYAAAVLMYENCLKKFFNNTSTELLLYIARALFKSNKLLECKKVLLRARYICPYDLVILFNLAKLLKTLSRQVFEDQKSTYQQVVEAEYELRQAKSYFKNYQDLLKDTTKSENDKSLIDPRIVELECQNCQDLLTQVENSIKNEAKAREEQEIRKRRDREQQLKSEYEKKAREESERLEEERKKREELENKRRELLKRQEEAKQKLLEDKQSSIINDEDSEDGSRRKKQKTKKKERSDKDGDKKRQERERPAERDNKKYKSRPLLSSDSSSSSSDDEGVL